MLKIRLVEFLENEMISSLNIFVDSIIRCLETERNTLTEIEESVII